MQPKCKKCGGDLLYAEVVTQYSFVGVINGKIVGEEVESFYPVEGQPTYFYCSVCNEKYDLCKVVDECKAAEERILDDLEWI